MIDLDQMRKEAGIEEHPVGAKFRDKTTGDVWSVSHRGGYAGVDARTGEFTLQRPVHGELRHCGYSYECKSSDGRTRTIYGDEIGREFEAVD
ncbi:MAG: hypothetical protein M9921_13045 [Fimbriimonadaceae bacterium]|nr:hypothetical protein [Fimbriimonadaceae bacterium]